MSIRNGLHWFAAVLLGVTTICPDPVSACCPAGRRGKPVVNADQTVVILWDSKTKTQHFIRKASFKSEGDDFGFLIPTPNEPQLNESGDDAFPFLMKLTEPETIRRPRPAAGISCGCGGKTKSKAAAKTDTKSEVKVLQEKTVAGFNAIVLEATSADAMLKWLNQRGYFFSPEVKAWAEPYVKQKWKITALKVAKAKAGETNVSASSLRLTFKTDRPLFPYREPDSKTAAESLGARSRMLRVYFLADARFQGKFDNGQGWSGKVAWFDKLSDGNRRTLLEKLKLPAETGPKEFWLTEFEDDWAYAQAPGDVYFSKDADQETVKREPIIEYTSSLWPRDPAVYGLIGLFVVVPIVRRVRRRRSNA